MAAESGDPPDNGLIGQVIAEKYDILRPLARGGMARIYLAEQQPFGREVVVKVLSPRGANDGTDPVFRRRFLREAEALGRLRHPNTVTVFDYGFLQGGASSYMVMEHVNGHTLAQTMKDEGALPAGRAIRIAYEICRSLEEAHGLGMVHRDLKPSNVMLQPSDEQERVRVLDFGIVKLVEDDQVELTREGYLVGSPPYMSPEQIQGRSVDGRTDIYALGVILFTMLTGRRPFHGHTTMGVLAAHLNQRVPTLAEVSGEVFPTHLEELVATCLRKQPEERYANVGELKEALRSAGRVLGTLELRTASAAMPAPEPSTDSIGAMTLDRSTGQTTEVALAPAKGGRRRLLLWALGVVALVQIVAVLWVVSRPDASSPDVAASEVASPDAEPPAGKKADGVALERAVGAKPAEPPAAVAHTVMVKTIPMDAVVHEGDMRLGSGAVQLGFSGGEPARVLVVSADGFEPRTIEVPRPPTPHADLTVELKPLPEPKPSDPSPDELLLER